MKKKREFPDRVAVYGGLALLLLLGIAAFVFRQDFSGTEKRYLAKTPSNLSLSDWTLNDDLETFLSDQIPFRRILVGVDSMIQTATGRAVQLETWPTGDAIVEPPVEADPEVLVKRIARMREIAGDTPCLFMIPPTAGMEYMDGMTAARRAVYEAESRVYEELTGGDGFIPLWEAYEAADGTEFYYSDHHWNAQGVYLAYLAYCRAAGLQAADGEAFTRTEYSPFYGTTASRSGLLFPRADTLVCLEPKAQVTMTTEDGETYDHLIFPEKAETWDGYEVYLNGNHGLVTVRNPEAEGGTLVIFRDSFASSLIPYLSVHYSEIIAADVRYYTGNFRDVLEEGGPADAILFLYSLDSLANDTSLARKLRQ